MIAGSLAWTAIVVLAWALLAWSAFNDLKSYDWDAKENRPYVDEILDVIFDEEEMPNRVQETMMIFFHNCRTVIWVWLVALGLALLIPAPVVRIVITSCAVAFFLDPNAFVLALVIAIMVYKKPERVRLFLAGTLPHGIPEVLAVCSILGHCLWLAFSGSSQLLSSLGFVIVSLLLMLLAAVIEVYITPGVIEHLR